MPPLSKEARSPRLMADRAEPSFARAGKAWPGAEELVLSTTRPVATSSRLADEAPRVGGGRTPFLGTASEARRPFELHAGEPAAMASALTGGPAAPAARPRGGMLRKAAFAAVAGLALVGAAAIAHSLGVVL